MFSIIMPAYNCEKTIAGAVDSVLQQTFKEYELIIVDDGSADKTIEICEDFAKRDDRITFCRSPHKGVSGARNLGISLATKENVLFIDSDDSWEPCLLEKCCEAIGEYEAVIFGVSHIVVDEKGALVSKKEGNALPADSSAEIVLRENFDAFVSSYNVAAPWNKVYKRRIIEEHGLSFCEECVYLEDFKFNIDYYRHVEKVKVIPESLYNYYLPLGVKSILKRRFKRPYCNADELFGSVKAFLEKNCVDIGDCATVISLLIKAYCNEFLWWIYGKGSAEKKEHLGMLNSNAGYCELLKNARGKFFGILRIARKLKMSALQMKIIKRRYW